MTDRDPTGHPVGRKTRARAIVEMLQLASDELDEAKREVDRVRRDERVGLARRLVADALVVAKRMEARA